MLSPADAFEMLLDCRLAMYGAACRCPANFVAHIDSLGSQLFGANIRSVIYGEILMLKGACVRNWIDRECDSIDTALDTHFVVCLISCMMWVCVCVFFSSNFSSIRKWNRCQHKGLRLDILKVFFPASGYCRWIASRICYTYRCHQCVCFIIWGVFVTMSARCVSVCVSTVCSAYLQSKNRNFVKISLQNSFTCS